MIKHSFLKKTILNIIVSLIVTMGYGQSTRETDSLYEVLEETHDIRKRIEVFALLSHEYHTIDLVKSKDLAYQALKLSNNAEIEEYHGDIFRSLGDIAIKEDSMELAKELYLRSNDYFTQQQRIKDKIMVLTVLGNIEYVKNQYADAMHYYLDALKLSEEHDFERQLPILYTNIGGINLIFNNYSVATENFSRALEGFMKRNDSINMAIIYSYIGNVNMLLNDTSLARYYLSKSSEIYLMYGNKYRLADNAVMLAVIEYENGSYEKAMQYISEAIEYLKSESIFYNAPSTVLYARCYLILGDCYFQLKDLPNAHRYYQKGFDIATVNQQLSGIADAGLGLAKVWEEEGNTDSSYHYYKIYHNYSDSLSNEENAKKLAYMDAQFRYEQERIKESEKEKQKRLIYTIIIIALLSVVIVMILLLKLWRTRARRSGLEQEALKKELETRNKELTTHVMYQVKKNEFILSISKKLQSGLYKLKPENRVLIDEIIRDLERDSSTDVWEEFEVRFHNVHSGFNKKLLAGFPDLTANELRLCAFLRLNMNTKDIAAITYQSVNSIDTARSRLRQKLNLHKDENLTAFLSQY